MAAFVHGKVKFYLPVRGAEEVYETAGDAYYAPPGHLPTLYAGTKVVEFGPSDGSETMTMIRGRTWPQPESGWADRAMSGVDTLPVGLGLDPEDAQTRFDELQAKLVPLWHSVERMTRTSRRSSSSAR